MKKTLDQAKVNLKMVEKFWYGFICPCHTPSQFDNSLKDDTHIPSVGLWFLAPEETE